MQIAQPSVFARDDTMLGVCEALGQDFGINPNILRVAFGAGLIWNGTAVLAIYVGLGVIVAISRWLFPSQAVVSEDARAHPTEATVSPEASNDDGAIAFAKAA